MKVITTPNKKIMKIITKQSRWSQVYFKMSCCGVYVLSKNSLYDYALMDTMSFTHTFQIEEMWECQGLEKWRMKLLKERILFSVKRRHVCPDITCANFLGKMKIALWPFVKVCSQRQFISILCLRRVKLSLIDEDRFEMIHWVGTKFYGAFLNCII